MAIGLLWWFETYLYLISHPYHSFPNMNVIWDFRIRLIYLNICFKQVWSNYVCQVSASGICTTPGRLTPSYYNQMAAAVNISYGLYHYGPYLVDLQDCTFVRQTFTVISDDHCPELRKYSKWIYTGLVMVSVAVMMSLIFWVIYARERRHRVYTKTHMPRNYGAPYEEKAP